MKQLYLNTFFLSIPSTDFFSKLSKIILYSIKNEPSITMPRQKKYCPIRKCGNFNRFDRPVRCDFSSSDSCDSSTSCDYKSYDYFEIPRKHCKRYPDQCYSEPSSYYSDDCDYSDHCEKRKSRRCDTCRHHKCRCPAPPPGVIPGTPCKFNAATGAPCCPPRCSIGIRSGSYCRFGNRNCCPNFCGPPVNLDWSEALGGWSYSLNVGWIPIVPGTTRPYQYC